MRIVQGIVGVETVVLVVLLSLVFQRADVAPPPLPPGAVPAQIAGDALAAATTDAAGSAPGSRVASQMDRERVDAAANAGHVVLLQGRLLGVDPPPSSNSVRLSCRRLDTYRSANVRDGVYAIAGMCPGTWRMRCEVEGCVKQEFDHVVGTAPLQRLDLTLEPALVLPVFLLTTDGARLQAELMKKLHITQGLQVIATEAPLAGDLEPTEHSSVGDIGLGRHRMPDIARGSDPDGPDGVLELDRAPPVLATLLLRHVVLAQQPIVPGQRELRFEVDPGLLSARLAKVRMRVLGVGGQPIPEATVRLSTAQGGGSGGKTDADGVLLVENALPGLTHVDVWAKDLERYAGHAVLPAGETTDLGDVVLTSPRVVRGRLVDGDGRGVGGTVQWTALDQWRPPQPMQDRRSAPADGDGNFELSLGARRYLVRGSSTDGRVGHAIIDAGQPATQRFVVAVATPTAVHIHAPDSFASYAVVVRSLAGDLLDVARIEARWREQMLKLPPGDYRIEIHDGHGGFLRRAPLHVGGDTMQLEVP